MYPYDNLWGFGPDAGWRITAPLGAITYTVQPGDTLYSISRRFNTTVDNILKFNAIPNPAMIQIGQRLVIPESPPESILYSVRPGDTLYSIARRYGTQVSIIMTFNYLTSTVIYPGQTLVVPTSQR